MKIHGVLPVLLLPFEEDETINVPALVREVDWQFAAGADGVVLAMVSEIFRLSDAERDEVVSRVVKATKDRGPVIASVGAESIAQAIRHARAAQAVGASALMAIPPVFTRCSANEIERYYRALLSTSSLPLIIQDASGYVGSSVPLSVQTTLYREFPARILFKPEGVQRGATISALLDATGGKEAIFDGMGAIALTDAFSRGAAGIMSCADVPWAVVELWRALKEGKSQRAHTIQAPLSALVALMQNIDAFVTIGKALLMKQGIFKNARARGPVGFQVDAILDSQLEMHLANLKQACA